MRTRVIGGLVTVLLLLPGAASSQEVDPCYVDPTAPGCVDVLDETEERGVGGAELCVDPVTGELRDAVTGEVVAGEPAPGTPLCPRDVDEVDVEVLAQVRSRPDSGALSALPVTGSDLAVGLLGVGLVGLGALLVVTTRHRRSSGA